MKSQDSQSRWSTKLGVSLSATLLASGLGAGAAHANADHAMDLMNIANARDAARAERLQLREDRRELRLQNKVNNAPSFVPNLSNSGNGFATAGTVSVSAQQRINEPRVNSAIIYPGQVSEFRTTRPSNRTTYLNDAGNEKILKKGVSLDLSSTASKITVGSNILDGGSVTISIGSEVKNHFRWRQSHRRRIRCTESKTRDGRSRFSYQ